MFPGDSCCQLVQVLCYLGSKNPYTACENEVLFSVRPASFGELIVISKQHKHPTRGACAVLRCLALQRAATPHREGKAFWCRSEKGSELPLELTTLKWCYLRINEFTCEILIAVSLCLCFSTSSHHTQTSFPVPHSVYHKGLTSYLLLLLRSFFHFHAVPALLSTTPCNSSHFLHLTPLYTFCAILLHSCDFVW